MEMRLMKMVFVCYVFLYLDEAFFQHNGLVQIRAFARYQII